MKKNIGNIFVSSKNYDTVFEIFYSQHFKNISQTIDSIISSYVDQSVFIQKKLTEIDNLKQINKELNEQVDSYRQKLIITD